MIKVKNNFKKLGFTLMELVVVMAILAIITIGLLGNYMTSQRKGKDAQRKSDLKQVQNALEAYANDHNGQYPDDNSGEINGASWGSSFQDASGTVYIKQLPQDPKGVVYFYRVSNDNIKYQLYACLENDQDIDYNKYPNTGSLCIGCGSSNFCNYGISSTNAIPSETI